MYTIEELKAELTKANVTKGFSMKEFQMIPKMLQEGEKVYSIVPTMHKNLSSGLLVATGKRLIFIDKKLFSVDSDEYVLSKVNAVGLETSWGSNTITVSLSGGTEHFVSASADRQAAQHFVDAVRQLMQTASPTTTGAADVATQLEKLANLKEKGLLTEAEFQHEKAKILQA